MPMVLSEEINLDVLWHFAGFTKKEKRPNWSGYIHLATAGMQSIGKSTITMLPIMDLNPSDESTIYSTLIFIKEQAAKQQIPTPCVTFDQPLWIKAVAIVLAKSFDMVARLGGFHSLMSFLGSLGRLMDGSGLEKLLEVIYGKNTIVHIFSGKAIARALRGHFLVDAALNIKLIEAINIMKQKVEH